jgi:hypothetical protein
MGKTSILDSQAMNCNGSFTAALAHSPRDCPSAGLKTIIKEGMIEVIDQDLRRLFMTMGKTSQLRISQETSILNSEMARLSSLRDSGRLTSTSHFEVIEVKAKFRLSFKSRSRCQLACRSSQISHSKEFRILRVMTLTRFDHSRLTTHAKITRLLPGKTLYSQFMFSSPIGDRFLVLEYSL